jgi:hypothetical protein
MADMALLIGMFLVFAFQFCLMLDVMCNNWICIHRATFISPRNAFVDRVLKLFFTTDCYSYDLQL